MRILVLNLGSTSSKVAVFEDETEKFSKTVRHDAELLAQSKMPADQLSFRRQNIFDAITDAGYALGDFDAVCARGGVLKEVESGTYAIDDNVIRDAQDIELGGRQPHGLGLVIAKTLHDEYGVPAYFCDPVSTDELPDVAKVTGFKGMERISRFHALNQKAVARKCAAALGKKYEDVRLIGVHLGGGTAVVAHDHGKCVEIHDCAEEEAFAMDRAGGLPTFQLVDYAYKAFQEGKTASDVKFVLKRQAGVFSYLGTSDMMEVQKRIDEGDEYAKLIFDAFAYQHAKCIGQCAAVLHFKVDAIFLTGGIAHSREMCDAIESYIGDFAPVYEFPGEEEMQSLALGALRVLRGEEAVKVYPA